MTMDEDKEGFAAEYALGTLDSDERAQADALLLVDPDFATEVRRWESRLGELNVLVVPVEPQDALWERIKSRIAPRPGAGEADAPARGRRRAGRRYGRAERRDHRPDAARAALAFGHGADRCACGLLGRGRGHARI